jgi:carbon starvation protein CstA
MKRWLKILERTTYAFAALVCAAILTAGGYFAVQMWSFSRPAVSARKLARLNSSMDTNQVKRVLGPPTLAEVFTNAEGRIVTSWTYRRPHVWKFVVISFDGDGKFEGHYED